MRRSLRSLATALAAALVALVVAASAGCSSGGPDDAGTATGAVPGAGSPAPVPDTSTAGPGCAVEGPEPAAGAVTRDVGDVDGDGKTDAAWLAPASEGAVTVGIRTAAGGTSAVAVTMTGPAGRSLLVADADGDGRSELFVSDGRTVDLYAFEGCTVTPVLDQEGGTYEFDLGVRGEGTGVGCVTVDGVRHLVGLNRTSDAGDQVGWTRTVVQIDGLLATEGPSQAGTSTLPADQAAVDRLSEVTCGDRTLAQDGLVLEG